MKLGEFEELPEHSKKYILEQLDYLYWTKRGIITAVLILTLSLGGCPMYNVWEQGLKGEAELARAEQNRQIAIQEALAKKESAQHEADAEAIKATGVKSANSTIADGLGGPEGYLRYLYIDALSSTNCSVVYVPTEAGLPILEANRKLN